MQCNKEDAALSQGGLHDAAVLPYTWMMYCNIYRTCIIKIWLLFYMMTLTICALLSMPYVFVNILYEMRI